MKTEKKSTVAHVKSLLNAGDKQKKAHQTGIKKALHPRNIHNTSYDFDRLMQVLPSLKPFVSMNAYGNLSIDFHRPEAVITLNKALLKADFQVDYWDLPSGNLCPPIPGRADYIHYIADLLAEDLSGGAPEGAEIRLLDIGTGASAIYAILANVTYGWSAVACDIDEKSIANVRKIIQKNAMFSSVLEARLQKNKAHCFNGIIRDDEVFGVSVCNPPFHASAKAAASGSMRKLQNLKGQKVDKVTLNFGGQSNELWCDGGEVSFVKKMILESQEFSKKCIWFTSLISKKDNLPVLYRALKAVEAVEVKTIEMKQGQKISRILAWTFMPKSQRKQRLLAMQGQKIVK